ncbi:MAG: ABC transporter ATP-binding protein [Candidatus Hadarchaeum sp.]
MSDIVIHVERLSKKYRIGNLQTRHETLREAVTNVLRRSLRDSRRPVQSAPSVEETIWALKDVAFDVKQGEIIGIIGPNGAGKSTLLKILARITEPTEGLALIKGRVSSLLEVGTGFHPELTGRENIYLNGAILGMRRYEIERKLDEIVAFAEIEKFLDTPVKRYSSGMYVRLAFAVAAHLEPEIMLVDEVLAVGDAHFQRKCLGRMESVSREGRTILFVSHNMAAIRHLCQRGLVLFSGEISFDGPSYDAVEHYLSKLTPDAQIRSEGLVFENGAQDDNHLFRIVRVEVLDGKGTIKKSLATGEYVRFRIVWHSSEVVERGGVEIGIYTLEGIPVIQYATRPIMSTDVQFRVGHNQIDCEFPQFPLAAGQYRLKVALTRPMVELLTETDFGIIEVAPRDVFQSGNPLLASRALVAVPHRWLLPKDKDIDREE